MIKKCINCGADFRVSNQDLKRGFGKFCRRKCYGEWQSKNSKMEKNHNWKGKLIECVCSECGAEFKKFESQIKRGAGKFCSRKCLGKWWSKNKSGAKSPNWKGGKTNPFVLVRNCERYSLWRRMVFIRDRFTCQKCGGSPSGHLEAHHKKRFVDLCREAVEFFPELAPYDACLSYEPLWDLGNGETLCDVCHGEIPTRNSNDVKI